MVVGMSFLCCVFLKESLKSGFIKKAVDKLKEVDKFLGTNQWFAGDRVSSSVLCSCCLGDKRSSNLLQPTLNVLPWK